MTDKAAFIGRMSVFSYSEKASTALNTLCLAAMVYRRRFKESGNCTADKENVECTNRRRAD
jgi:hypothetical protein